jgi:tetratricopeptide (TPR) repeat protein
VKPETSREREASRFPFSTSFQFREDESAALEALFERVCFEAPYGERALGALERIQFLAAPTESSPAEAPIPAAAPGVPDSPRYVILCRGADGIGKTRIFNHLRERACARQVPVYETFNYEVEGIPLKAFLHTIRRIVGEAERGPMLLEKYRYALESLIPEAFDAPVMTETTTLTGEDPLAAAKLKVYDGITQLLLEVSAQRPLIILVHDLHWGDRGTVELLRYIGRNLQLHNDGSLALGRRRSRAPGEIGVVELPTGPEIEGFESDEWRVLAPRTAGLPAHAWSFDGLPEPCEPRYDRPWDAPGPAAMRGEAGGRDRPARLMILANYRAFPQPSHYIQEAIDSLGEETFAYHGELRPLNRAEADRFLQTSIQGVAVGERELEVSPEAIDAIFGLSEGFPSFQQELFRGVFLADRAAYRWTEEAIRAFAGTARRAEDAGASAASKDGGGGGEALPPADSPRHAILRGRLAVAQPAELRILQMLALARRPVKAELVQRVLAGVDEAQREDASGAAGEVQPVAIDAAAVLSALEERGLVVHSHDGGEAEGYYFRLWDYTRVVEETIAPELRRLLHQKIGEECRARLDEHAEGAYEIYYHLRRGSAPVSAVEFGRAAAQRCVRSFALEKARLIYRELLDLLEGPEHLSGRLDILERIARLSLSLKDRPAAEEALRRIAAEGSGALSPAARLDLLLLEAEVARAADPAKALKVLGKAPRLLSEEVSPAGARLHLSITRARLGWQDWKRAINFGLKGITICQKLGSAPELGAFYQLVARAFYRKGDYAHAVDNYQRGLEAAERLGGHALIVDILDELGRVYLERGNYFRSARYLYKALETRRREHDIAGLCRSYDQLALVYRRTGDYLKTIENLNRSLHLRERIGDFAGLNPSLGTLGDLYFRLGHYQRALRYFRAEVENSKKSRGGQLDDTGWLADAFVRLGGVYFEIGDLKQAESLCKQVSILASEFKLRSQEADGMVLEGKLKAHHREWAAAEKSLRLAAEAHAKLGHRLRETSALLDLAEVKFAREYYDESLKLASKAQIIADEVKALDLQVRALTIKGNVHRFLKGGNQEKVKELLAKALELAQNLGDVNVLFQLHYSLAKVFHGESDLAEAGSHYTKAEVILKRIGDSLPEDLAARFLEDRRRKVFAEDVARFRKEAQSRAVLADSRERSLAPGELRERPAGIGDYKDLLERVLRAHGALNHLGFHDRLLAEAVELVGAERGFLLMVQNRQYHPVAFHGFGKHPTQHSHYAAAGQLTQEAIRRGKAFLNCDSDDESLRKLPQLGALSGLSLIVVPLMTEERIFGGIYLDKPSALGRFGSRDHGLMECYAQQAGVALQSRRQFEVAIREPLTGFFTPSYFIDRLRESYRWFNLHGKAFALAGFYLPGLEDALGEGRRALGEKLALELSELLPYPTAICWGNPVLYLLLPEADHVAEEIAERVKARLYQLLNEEVSSEVLAADSHYQQGAEMYFEMRRKLLPEECDHKTLAELRRLLARNITLKEAKMILEKHLIESTLRKTGGNITHAARELGIHRPQLSNLVRKYALKREVFEQDFPESGGLNPLEN